MWARPSLRALPVLLGCTLVLGACGTRPRTEAVVVISNAGTPSLKIPDDIDAIRILVRDETAASTRHEETISICHALLTTGCYPLPLGMVLIPGDTASDDAVRVEITALRNGVERIAGATVFHFTPDKRLRLDFPLYTACLEKLDCDETGNVCGDNGRCQPLTPVVQSAPVDLALAPPATDSAVPDDLVGADLTDLAPPDDLVSPEDLVPPSDLSPEFPHWLRRATLVNLKPGMINQTVEAGFIGSRVFIFQGRSEWIRSVDVATGDIAVVDTAESPINVAGFGGTLVAANNKLFYFSGATEKEIFDGATWKDASYPTIRGEAAVAVMANGDIYHMGGRVDATTQFTTEVRRYSSTANSWTLTGFQPRPLPHSQACATQLDGKVYVLGGLIDETDTSQFYFYVYDPTDGAMGQWTRKADMPVGTSRGVAVAYNGFVWYMRRTGTDEIRGFSPSSEKWEGTITPPPNVTIDTTRTLVMGPGPTLYYVGQQGEDTVLYEYVP